MLRLALVALVFLCSCNQALRAAMERAEGAHARGDHFGEAIALKDACAAAHDEKEICTAAKQAADEVIGKHLETAAGPCATEPNACLAHLEVLAPFANAGDPRLMPFFDRAGDMLAERCGKAPLASPEDAVFHVRCTEAYRKKVPTRAFAVHIAEARGRAAEWLDHAAAPLRGSQPGVGWLYESLAGCLGSQSGYAGRVAAYRSSFDDAHSVRLQISGQAPYPPAQMCAGLREQSGTLVRCEGRAGTALKMEINGWLDDMSDAAVREVRTVEVLDHVERWENPDYRYAQQNVRHLRNRYEDAQRQTRLAESECNTAQSQLSRARYCYNCYERTYSDQACNRKSTMDDFERRSRSELSDAERTLSSTPAQLTRDVYRTVSYRHVQHRFRVPWHVKIAVADVPYERSGALTYETTEREGVPAAKIAFMPYSEPSTSQRNIDLATMVVEQAGQALSAELERIAATRLAGCPGPEVWSDCQIEVSLLRRTDPVAQFVEDVGTRLDSRSQQPWPQAACVP